VEQINRNLARHKIERYTGSATFEDPHTLRVLGTKEERIRGEFILIATGSYPFRPAHIPFDDDRVHDSDSILSLKRLPRSLCVIGAGVIGCEYTTIFATMGIPVFLINSGSNILPFLDGEIAQALLDQMRRDRIDVILSTEIERVTVPTSESELLRVELKTGEILNVDMLLYAAGRSGNTARLACAKAGVKLGRREVVEVDAEYRTSVPHIYAAGDVIGFPALASTSMDQGRAAVTHMFQLGGIDALAKLFPYGIYTVPEVSMVGMTEEEAKQKGIDFCVGRARYRDMARGKILGAQDGFLKLVFDRQEHTVLGVHIIGNLATEVVHYGMTLVQNRVKLDDMISVVFNYPTLHDLYKYAAYDGLGNASGHKLKD
jgi:NAD(P) transhydrogenase